MHHQEWAKQDHVTNHIYFIIFVLFTVYPIFIIYKSLKKGNICDPQIFIILQSENSGMLFFYLWVGRMKAITWDNVFAPFVFICPAALELVFHSYINITHNIRVTYICSSFYMFYVIFCSTDLPHFALGKLINFVEKRGTNLTSHVSSTLYCLESQTAIQGKNNYKT